MELQDILGFVFVIFFLGTPLAAVYFCLRFSVLILSDF